MSTVSVQIPHTRSTKPQAKKAKNPTKGGGNVRATKRTSQEEPSKPTQQGMGPSANLLECAHNWVMLVPPLSCLPWISRLLGGLVFWCNQIQAENVQNSNSESLAEQTEDQDHTLQVHPHTRYTKINPTLPHCPPCIKLTPADEDLQKQDHLRSLVNSSTSFPQLLKIFTKVHSKHLKLNFSISYLLST